MIGLLGKLAYANLLNNRRLYLPFALATIVSSAIFYVFCALAANPFLSEVYGADTIKVNQIQISYDARYRKYFVIIFNHLSRFGYRGLVGQTFLCSFA